ncbi:hypothetical protein MXB_1850 [Myxobolus squamalis]|nr:hypothetical protein MXB_1850 [Myxobolus squamalis]
MIAQKIKKKIKNLEQENIGTKPWKLLGEVDENIIKTRIRDKTWDDVERIKKHIDQEKFRIPLTRVSAEKSKEGLAEVYERSYLDAVNQTDKAGKERPEVISIRKELTEVVELLNALSNHNFAPQPIAPEIKIGKVTRALNVEEVLPVYASDCLVLAPEEIAPPISRLPPGPKEITHSQMNGIIRKKKAFRRKKDQDTPNKNFKSIITNEAIYT